MKRTMTTELATQDGRSKESADGGPCQQQHQDQQSCREKKLLRL